MQVLQPFIKKLMDWGTDAIAILGQANKWLNVRRKDLHKKDMDPKLHYLCSSSLQSIDQLYEDSIIKDIKRRPRVQQNQQAGWSKG